jgi:Ca-activated chloride channel family protein
MSSIIPNITFAHPAFFLLLLLIVLVIFIKNKRKKSAKETSLTISTRAATLDKLPVSWKVRWQLLLNVLRIITLISLIIALARPQKVNDMESMDSDGIDIVLSIDISGSMLAEDFKPNRLEAAKENALKFINTRAYDRIGLVIFSGESFMQCPITIDHRVLKAQLEQIQSGTLQDGTAIGDGLASAVDRLRDAKGKSKVVILMTDGINNTGKVGPELALEIAKRYQVRVYTIGIGSEGMALSPVQTPFGIEKQMMPVQIDEALLQRIAQETNGKYYRATDNNKLKAIYEDIDQLEKSTVKVNAYKQYKELYFPLALIALGCLVLEILLRYTLLRKLP